YMFYGILLAWRMAATNTFWRLPMKRLVVGILGSLILVFLAARPAAAQEKTFRGEITDEHLNCIQTPMKAPPELKEKNACVLYWAHFTTPPSKYVLYDPATKSTY